MVQPFLFTHALFITPEVVSAGLQLSVAQSIVTVNTSLRSFEKQAFTYDEDYSGSDGLSFVIAVLNAPCNIIQRCVFDEQSA